MRVISVRFNIHHFNLRQLLLKLRQSCLINNRYIDFILLPCTLISRFGGPGSFTERQALKQRFKFQLAQHRCRLLFLQAVKNHIIKGTINRNLAVNRGKLLAQSRILRMLD
ncbi:hypothetical protein D3C77_432430 [compost metagenome]